MSTKREVSFEKFHGAGNDFIFLASQLLATFVTLDELKKFAITICSRNKGVGADGLVIYNNSVNSAELRVEILIVNSDGSIPETCGNALRCLGLKLQREQLWSGNTSVPIYRLPLPNHFQVNDLVDEEKFVISPNSFAFLTAAQFGATTTAISYVEVAMGIEQSVKEIHIETQSFANISLKKIELNSVYVQLANPHWVFIAKEFGEFTRKDFFEFGEFAQNALRKQLRNTAVPKANIGMIWPTTKANEFHLVVYERGAGLTECCGSGGVAARIALEFHGKVHPGTDKILFKMPGGDIQITAPVILENFAKQRILIGPAEYIFSGKYIF